MEQENPFLHTPSPVMCPVVGVMHSTTQVFQRGILQPTVNSHCLEDKTEEMDVSLHYTFLPVVKKKKIKKCRVLVYFWITLFPMQN